MPLLAAPSRMTGAKAPAWPSIRPKICTPRRIERISDPMQADDRSIMKIDIPTLRVLAENDRIAFKKHSILRMNQREISVDEVRDVFMQGEIIEIYPEARPLPCCLLLGFGTEGKPLHVVVAVDDSERMLWVITVYRPLKEEWDETCKRRKPS